MLKGWESYSGGHILGGEAVADHYARARELDDLDERLLRHHPELRAGVPS